MNATTEATCPRNCPWPPRECGRCDPPPASYVAPILLIGGITALGYVALGATLILAGRLAWHAAQALAGHP